MNYELARALKDAGFKQQGRGRQIPDTENGEGVYLPTLEELIEACGDENFILGRTRERGGRGGHLGNWDAQIYTSNTRTFAEGSTPTEAVAKLWLALNPKTS